MTLPSMILHYVSDVARSQDFYGALLGLQPVESSPTFCLFVLPNGLKLGLWGRLGVEPAATLMGGGGELAFPVADAATLEAVYQDWSARGLSMIQPPTDMDFGRTFTAVDPDGHRLRVFFPFG